MQYTLQKGGGLLNELSSRSHGLWFRSDIVILNWKVDCHFLVFSLRPSSSVSSTGKSKYKVFIEHLDSAMWSEDITIALREQKIASQDEHP